MIKISKSDLYGMRDGAMSVVNALDEALRRREAEVAAEIASQDLPGDVARLVIAARIVSLGDIRHCLFVQQDPELCAQIEELDKAAEAFADRVPWDDDPNDEEPEPRILHGTLDIDGQTHAIKVELYGTEGGVFDADGHAVEDDGFETVDLGGFHQVPEPIEMVSSDPRFNPAQPIIVNGFTFYPAVGTDD